jgi:hypothetical protein
MPIAAHFMPMRLLGFQNLGESGRIVETACWVHARRKFYDIHIEHASPTMSEAIERVAALCTIEAEIRARTPEIRKTIRQARARPLIDSMHTWPEPTLAKLSLATQEKIDVLTGDEGARERVESLSWLATPRLTNLDPDKSKPEGYTESNVLPVRE